MHAAPVITHFADLTIADGDQLVSDGDPIKIYAIVITSEPGDGAIAVDFKNNTAAGGRAAGAVFLTLAAGDGDSENTPFPFIADGGLVVDVIDDTAQVTIFHSNKGA